MTNCYRCKKDYTFTHSFGHTEYDNCLALAVSGGYGEFIDTQIDLVKHSSVLPVEPKAEIKDDTCLTCASHLLAILCHECAHELMDWLGVPKEEVENWHTHRVVPE